MAYFDEIFRARAERAGIVYVDIWDGFVDESGRYVTQGPDFEGQIRRLRTGDGVHFTKFGAIKLAQYVAQDLRRVMSSHVVPVALPAPESGPAKPGGGARPAVGPVLPLSADTSVDGTNLLGDGGRSAPANADPVAVRVLTHGDPIPGAVRPRRRFLLAAPRRRRQRRGGAGAGSRHAVGATAKRRAGKSEKDRRGQARRQDQGRARRSRCAGRTRTPAERIARRRPAAATGAGRSGVLKIQRGLIRRRAGAARALLQVADHAEQILGLRIAARAEHADEALGRRTGCRAEFFKATVALI